MSEVLDLLGDPIPEGHGKRGRPPHRVTDEKRKLVIMLQAFGWSIERIAAALSCSQPTLRKNYFRELRAKAESRARVEAAALEALIREAQAGNVSAIDKLLKRLDKIDLSTIAGAVAGAAAGAPASEKPQKLGKKEQRKLAAGDVAGVFAPRQGPTKH